jgi:hypothetical protein
MGYGAGTLKSNPGSDGVVETSVERRERRVSLVNQACHTPKTESRQSHGVPRGAGVGFEMDGYEGGR